MNIAYLVKEVISPVINKNLKYKIELFDDLNIIYDQQRAWIEKTNAIRTILASNQRRVVIKTSQSEISNFQGLSHTSFNWYMEIYARRDDEEVLEDLNKLINELKEKIIVVDGYKVYLTFTTPLPQISELDNGVWMRTISFSGSGIVCDNAYLADEIKLKINNIEIDTVLAFSSGMNATGESYQIYNNIVITTIVENVNSGFKVKVIYKEINPILQQLFYLSLGDVSNYSTSSKFPITFEIKNKTINWNNSRLINCSCETSKGGIVMLVADFVKE